MPEIEAWSERWADGSTTFHRAGVHDRLIQFKDKFLVKTPSRVFVPLCGKSVDMKWLVDEGHEVVGVEGVTQAIKEFFQEQSLEYKESDVPGVEGAKLYQTKDGKIKLFKCDFFAFSKDLAGQFDAIWDRGSLVAVDPCDRPKYFDLVTSLLSPGGRILSEIFFYNPEERNPKGPPHSMSEADVQKLYGEKFTIEQLSDAEYLEGRQRFKDMGLTWMRQHILLMTLK